jgi:Flp pilus assembly protein TadG
MSGRRRVFAARARRGASAVEFALTAPILFILVLGAVEFSRANMLVHTTSIAATEAARRSIIAGATVAEVRLKALDELDNVGIIDATVEVQPAEIVDDTTQVTVNLSVPVTMRNGYGLSRVFLGKQVFKSVTLQREGKTEELTAETIQYDGMQVAPNTGGNGNSGNNGGGNGNGNNGNGNGNGGGNGSNGQGGGNGNTGGTNSGSGSSGSNSGSGSSGSNSGSGSSGSGSAGSSGSGSSGGGGDGGGFWGALRQLLGL